MRKVKVFTGSSHPQLAALVVERLGLHPATVTLRTFANHESSVELGVSVRNEDVFIIQSGSDHVNDHLMELLILIHACRSAAARRITAILPCFPYSKQSKKKKARGSITAKLIANMLDVAGVDHIITMDLHSSQIQGFFNRPVDNLFAEPSIAKYIRDYVPDYINGVVVSKNAGGAKRVTSLADRLKIGFALIHTDDSYKPTKQESSSALTTMVISPPPPDENGNTPTGQLVMHKKERSLEALDTSSASTGMTLVGDVHDRIAFIADDMIDNPRSFIRAANHLKQVCGAKRVYLVATHGIFSGNALSEIEQCANIHSVIVTNSCPLPDWKRQQTSKLQVIDISSVLAEAIRRTHNGESISYLFDTAIA